MAPTKVVSELLLGYSFRVSMGAASETSARLSLEVLVATAAKVPHPEVPTALAGHAFHLGACCQTSIESIHTSDLALQTFNVSKDI
jgi:hypothetical protein